MDKEACLQYIIFLRYNEDMKKEQYYFFILGNNVNLSLAELAACFEKWGSKYQLIRQDQEVAIIQIDDFTNEQFATLGGCKKYGLVNQQTEQIEIQDVTNFILAQAKPERFNFGFSYYGFKLTESKKIGQQFFREGLSIKKELKTRNIKSRLVQSKQEQLSSVIVDKEKMIDQGCDLNIMKLAEKYYLGKTLAVQDYHAFSKRDYGRPKRDARSGMLPPKLARMMLNFAQSKEDDVLLDPFCGSGTVIMEALVLGWQKIYGTDKSKIAIDSTHQNLMWLQQKVSFSEMPHLEILPVMELNKSFDPRSIDQIVTEPYLGPPLRSSVRRNDIDNTIDELTELYALAYRRFAEILKPGGRVVMIWPIFVFKEQLITLEMGRIISELGFVRVDHLAKFKLQDNRLIYQRPEQLVQRRIEIWQRQ